MKSSEIRIGNYFTDKEDNEQNGEKYNPINKVIAIQRDYIYFLDIEYGGIENEDLEQNGGIELSCCLPIPLTIEWIIKFGFKKNKKGEYSIYNKSRKIHPLKIYSRWVSDNSFGFFSSNCYIEIKYVHQLQNLYYIITGDELIETKKTLNNF